MTIDQSKWNNVLKFRQLTYEKGIENSFNSKLNQKSITNRIGENDKVKAIDHLFEEKIDLFKSRMSFAAMVFEFSFSRLNEVWPRWNMKPYSYALLSDNKALMERYVHLLINEQVIFDDPKKGIPAYWNYLIQGLLSENMEQVDKGLKSLFDKNISKNKEISISRAHQLCTEGILHSKVDLIVKGLREFELKRNKSRFVKNDICENIISFFPIAYAKIAWLKGIEVDPESKYMPIELLEVRPLEEYTIPYWFLRDYYREQGVDWRYDPIHPELQDWDNDPENPDRKKGGFFKALFG